MNALNLTWTNPAHPSPEGVYIEVEGPQPRVIALPGALTQARVDGLRNGVEIRVRVIAVTRDGSAEPSAWARATPSTGAEGVVAGLIVKFTEPVADGQLAVPGEELVDDAALTAGERIGDATLIELGEAVDLATADAIAAKLAADPAVEWAEPDQFLLAAAADPTEVSSTAWNLNGAYGVDSATQDAGGSSGQGVTVAVIDTGITAHPALDARLVAGYDFVSGPDTLAAARHTGDDAVAFDGDYVDAATFGVIGRDANPADPGDWRDTSPARASSWHGTQVASIIADVAPGARIEPIRALSWRGGLLSDIAAAITWASGGSVDGAPANSNPAHVINLSFTAQAVCPIALQSAIDAARARGAVLVAAAGNASDDASGYAPANCDGVITVGATTSAGVRASYSNYGSVVDLSAPGGDSVTPVVAASNAGATTPGGPTLAGATGTSVAAAHVAAAAAVLVGKQAGLTPDDTYRALTGRNHIKAFADDVCDTNPDYSCGAGILTLGESLAQIAAAGDTDYHMNFSGSAQRAMGPTGFYPVKAASGESFTVSAWVFDNRDSQTGFKYVAAQQQSLSSSFFLGLQDRNITLTDWDSEAVLPAKQWVHVAATRSGTTAILYVNGSEVDRITNYNPDRWYASGQQFRIGSFVDNRANEDWTGYIDQVKVYDTALSAPQVLGDMQSWGVASGVSSGSLVAAYDFNEGSGSTVVNQGSVGSSGNLTTVNSPTWRSLVTPSTSGTTTTVLFPRSYLTSTGGWTAPVGVGSGTALVVGGGGAGGFDGGGGGGGGGTWTGTATLNAGGVNAVTVGQGGAPRVGYNPANNCWDGNSTGAIGCSGNSGTTSSFASVGATGGGGGGGKNAGGSSAASSTTDGSGGGGGGNDFTAQQAGGTGRYNGGSGGATTDPARTMGGGGGGVNGAGAVGNGNNNTAAGRGGSGFTSSLSGSALVYGTGGSGGAWVNCSFCIVNMTGTGAGTGGWDATAATSGTPNQGGGGGGAGGRGILGGYGGSGVVILQYATVPGAPDPATATAGQQQVTLSWTAPTYTGGSGITGYRPQFWGGSSWVNPSAGTCTTATTSTATSCTITGLTAGTTYSFQVQAINDNGSGDWASTNTAVPFGPLSKFAFSAIASPQLAGVAFMTTITAQDSGGRTVTTFTGTVDLTTTSVFGAGGGTTGAFTAGVLSNRSITLARAGVNQTLTATKTGGAESGTSASFAISPDSAAKLQVLLPGETAAPGTATGKSGTPVGQSAGTAFTVTVNAVDANWNVVTSQTPTVHLTSSDSAANLPADAALVSGTKAFSVTLNTQGSQTVTAVDTASSSPLAGATSASVTVGKAAQAPLFIASTSGTFGQALTLTTSGGSGTGAVTFVALDGTAAGCTVTGTSSQTLSVTQAGTCLVTATKAADADYDSVSSAQTPVTFARAQQAPLVITSQSSVAYGDKFTLMTSGGSGTGAVTATPGTTTGTATCLVASSSTNELTGTNAGGTCEVIMEKAADVNYQQALATQNVTVTTRPITVTASSPTVGYGTAFTPSVSVTTGSLAFSDAISGATFTYQGTGSTTYGPSTTPPTAIGTYAITPSATTFSVGYASNYDIAYADGALTITRAAQTITFANPQPTGASFGLAPFIVAATASSNLAVTFSLGAGTTNAACAVSGATLSITGVGVCEITASQSGDATYAAAADVSRSFTVTKGSQAPLVATSASTISFGEVLTLAAAGGSGTGAISFSAADGTASGCAVSGGVLVYTTTGTCLVSVNRASDANFNAATPATQTVTIARAGQTLAFASVVPTTPTAGDTYAPIAASTSNVTGLATGLTPTIAVATASSAVCSLTNGVVTFAISGSCVLEANQPQTANFTAAAQVTQTIVVGARNQSMTFAQPAAVAYGSSSFTVSASASSNLPAAFALGSGTTNGACAVSSLGVVTVLAVGTCEVVASQGGDPIYAPASPLARAFAVEPTLPTAPALTSASASDQAMTVGFVAPGFTGGVSITAYELVATPVGGGATVTSTGCAASPCTISGLANGTAYTVTVAAINAAGTGPASSASWALTAAGAASTVGALSATPGDGLVVLAWSPLTNAQLGGGTFTRYQISWRAAGSGTWTLAANLTNQLDDTYTVTGLSNSTAYEFQVVAFTTANFVELPGNTAFVAEFPSTLPTAPVALAALRATPTSVQVSWQVPVSNGGAPLVAPYYLVTVTSMSAGATSPVTCVLAMATDRFCEAANLTAGASYDITVAAVNRMGTGPAAATTYGVPAPPPNPAPTPNGDASAGVATNPAVPVAPPSNVLRGDAVGGVMENGVLLTGTTFMPIAGGWTVGDGSGFTLAVVAQNESGEPMMRAPSGALSVPQGGRISLAGDGYAADSTVTVFAIPRASMRAGARALSGASFLGWAAVDGRGAITTTVPIPRDFAVGGYVLQVNGVSTQGATRSVNLLMDVVSAPKPRVGFVREAAFFAGRSDLLTATGKQRLRAMIAGVPVGADAVQVTVIGVSVSLDSRRANLTLARNRADAIAAFLEAGGVKGEYTVMISTTFTVRSGSVDPQNVDVPVIASNGQPLTTASIAFVAPSSSR